ncbi:MAG: Hsp20/alpha crystallin family protein [Candidatus Brennerbacteria bacterium]|nr:Hsp20/alpha crystallin family protein [Candidatus Brennerbacteria bacterium]
MEQDNKDDIFVELAKVKSEPKPLHIETEDKNFELDDESEGQLTVDVYADKDYIVVQSTVAGVDPEDLEINITNESVTIKGKREKTEKIEDKNYFYQECFWGRFSRSIILPEEVDPEKSTAALKNGVLTVRMPKLNRKKAKKLKVKFD